MLHLIYIGTDKNIISIFKDNCKDCLSVSASAKEAIEKLQQIKQQYCTVFLFEKKKLQEDIKSLKEIKKKASNIYNILVTDQLDEMESKIYFEMGINNTIPCHPNKETFKALFDFFELRKRHKIDELIKRPNESIKKFRLPCWKRTLDLIIASTATIALSPLLLGTALLIKCESKGPIIYKSKRVGSNYKIFKFYKFRTMFSNAEEQLKKLDSLNQYKQQPTTSTQTSHQQPVESILVSDDMDDILISDDTNIDNVLISDDYVITENDFMEKQKNKVDNNFVKIEKDPRITKIGRILRKYSIDELPQLFNIIKGDMSIVGNRPLPLYEAELLTNDDYIDRFMAPAGLTGLWQISKRGKAGKLSAEERKMLDIKYANEFSLMTDLKIIFKTFGAFIQEEEV